MCRWSSYDECALEKDRGCSVIGWFESAVEGGGLWECGVWEYGWTCGSRPTSCQLIGLFTLL